MGSEMTEKILIVDKSLSDKENVSVTLEREKYFDFTLVTIVTDDIMNENNIAAPVIQDNFHNKFIEDSSVKMNKGYTMTPSIKKYIESEFDTLYKHTIKNDKNLEREYVALVKEQEPLVQNASLEFDKLFQQEMNKETSVILIQNKENKKALNNDKNCDAGIDLHKIDKNKTEKHINKNDNELYSKLKASLCSVNLGANKTRESSKTNEVILRDYIRSPSVKDLAKKFFALEKEQQSTYKTKPKVIMELPENITSNKRLITKSEEQTLNVKDPDSPRLFETTSTHRRSSILSKEQDLNSKDPNSPKVLETTSTHRRSSIISKDQESNSKDGATPGWFENKLPYRRSSILSKEQDLNSKDPNSPKVLETTSTHRRSSIISKDQESNSKDGATPGWFENKLPYRRSSILSKEQELNSKDPNSPRVIETTSTHRRSSIISKDQESNSKDGASPGWFENKLPYRRSSILSKEQDLNSKDPNCPKVIETTSTHRRSSIISKDQESNSKNGASPGWFENKLPYRRSSILSKEQESNPRERVTLEICDNISNRRSSIIYKDSELSVKKKEDLATDLPVNTVTSNITPSINIFPRKIENKHFVVNKPIKLKKDEPSKLIPGLSSLKNKIMFFEELAKNNIVQQ